MKRECTLVESVESGFVRAASGSVGVESMTDVRFVFDFFENFFASNRNVGRGLNADANGIPIDLHDRDTHVVTDLEPLTEPPAQDQHDARSLSICVSLSFINCSRKS